MKKRKPVGYQYKCAVCGRCVLPKVPKGGDGSMLVPHRHSHAGVVCDGSYKEAEEISSNASGELPLGRNGE